MQVPVFELLHKYDGQRVHHDIKAGRRRYQFLRLPRFLGLHMKRFARNNFYVSPYHYLTCQRRPLFCVCLEVSAGGLWKNQVQNCKSLALQIEKNPTIVNFPVKNLLLEGAVALPKGACSCCVIFSHDMYCILRSKVADLKCGIRFMPNM